MGQQKFPSEKHRAHFLPCSRLLKPQYRPLTQTFRYKTFTLWHTYGLSLPLLSSPPFPYTNLPSGTTGCRHTLPLSHGLLQHFFVPEQSRSEVQLSNSLHISWPGVTTGHSPNLPSAEKQQCRDKVCMRDSQ